MMHLICIKGPSFNRFGLFGQTCTFPHVLPRSSEKKQQQGDHIGLPAPAPHIAPPPSSDMASRHLFVFLLQSRQHIAREK